MINLKLMKYDYIIAGSGCAGLSLLYTILNQPKLSGKKILVLDRDHKTENDRTWCFWEKKPGLFEPIVYHKWDNLIFKTEKFTKLFHLEDYSYKMIRGIDFYENVLAFANKFPNVEFAYGSIESIDESKDCASVKIDGKVFTADYIFNSTSLFHPTIDKSNTLLQHFEGWVIKTDSPKFDKTVGTLMDFSVGQENGATFMYVLPTSETEALIEYTLFSPELLKKEDYKTAIKKYLKEDLAIENYEIQHTEFGVIPMTMAKFERFKSIESRIINIGTAGGFTKASSGYTFQFIQKNSEEIVNRLLENKSPTKALSISDKIFNWYDRTLLEVLISKKATGKEIFSTMFGKLNPTKIIPFLGNESSLLTDIQIMKTLPIVPFLKAGIKQLYFKK